MNRAEEYVELQFHLLVSSWRVQRQIWSLFIESASGWRNVFSKLKSSHVINTDTRCLNQLRYRAVGWGTALQVGWSRFRFPIVSLKFFIDIILPAALWPWGWLSL